MPTGTLTLNPESDLRYGGAAFFDVTHDVVIRDPDKERVYVTTVCYQGEKPTHRVVYQASDWTAPFGFPLEDQSGDNLDWTNERAAHGEAHLIYRVQKGKGFVFTTIAPIVKFEVAGA